MAPPNSLPATSRPQPNATFNPSGGIKTPLVQNYFGPASLYMNVFGQPGDYNVSVNWNVPPVGFGYQPHHFNGGPMNPQLVGNAFVSQVPNGPFVDPVARGLPDANNVGVGRGGGWTSNGLIPVPSFKTGNPPGAPKKFTFEN